MFLGIVILVVASLVLELLGFMVTSALVLFFYGLRWASAKYARLVIASVLITLVLYIVFSGLLSVNLPRGTVPFLLQLRALPRRVDSIRRRLENEYDGTSGFRL